MAFAFLLWPVVFQSFKKFLRADAQILTCTILGQNWVQNCPPEGIFFNVTYLTFIYQFCPTLLQSFRKFVSADPDILVCVIFVQNLTICPERGLFVGNFYLFNFCPVKYYHAAKFQKKC